MRVRNTVLALLGVMIVSAGTGVAGELRSLSDFETALDYVECRRAKFAGGAEFLSKAQSYGVSVLDVNLHLKEHILNLRELERVHELAFQDIHRRYVSSKPAIPSNAAPRERMQLAARRAALETRLENVAKIRALPSAGRIAADLIGSKFPLHQSRGVKFDEYVVSEFRKIMDDECSVTRRVRIAVAQVIADRN